MTQIACYSLGLLALVTVAGRDPNQIFGSFIAIPLGGLTFAVLTVRELDQSFADTYSTAVSVQNLRPAWDRRALAVGVGLLATIGALAFNSSDYENFLILIGSLFVPLLGVLVIDYFVLSRGRWDLSEHARPRWTNLLAWAVGFVAYQLVNGVCFLVDRLVEPSEPGRGVRCSDVAGRLALLLRRCRPDRRPHGWPDPANSSARSRPTGGVGNGLLELTRQKRRDVTHVIDDGTVRDPRRARELP